MTAPDGRRYRTIPTVDPVQNGSRHWTRPAARRAAAERNSVRLPTAYGYTFEWRVTHGLRDWLGRSYQIVAFQNQLEPVELDRGE